MLKPVFAIVTTPARIISAVLIVLCFAVAIVATLTGALSYLLGAIVVGTVIAYWRGIT